MSDPDLYPRFAAERLVEALDDSPAVLVHGPRQCGKTTLARTVCEPRGFGYVTFDETVARAAAQADPRGFLDDLPSHVVLDEVQHVPSLFAALKTTIDRKREPGRFVLTGSSNVLLLPALSDSLAGRMEVIRLHPLAQAEVAGHRSTFLESLFDARFPTRSVERLGRELAERVAGGGYPAALARKPPRRAAWYRNYADALVSRDVRDLAQIRALDVIPRLLAAAAASTGRLLNVADLASPFHVSRPTVAEYLVLLERLFLIERLAPWHSNRLSRLVKTPKIHLSDSGLASALLGADAADLAGDRNMLGPLLETFVLQELRRHASWHEQPCSWFHFRDKAGAEVDVVIERGSRLAGVEIKAAATVHPGDFAGLRKLRDATGARFAAGVVLYDGETCASFGDGLFAVPIRMLWEPWDAPHTPKSRRRRLVP